MKAREIKARRYGATDQRPVACAACGLPMMRRHDQLRRLTRQHIRPQHVIRGRPRVSRRPRQDQRAACVVKPNLRRVDGVLMADLTPLQ